MGKSAGCDVKRLVGAVFCLISPGRELGSLKGSCDDDEGRRVGEGRSGRASSLSSSSSSKTVGSRLDEFEGESVSFDEFCAAAAAKIFLLFGIADAAPVRRGESEREAMDMGEGSDIWTSMGESYVVRARENGVRVVFFGWGLGCEVGLDVDEVCESRERELKSVEEGKEADISVIAEDC